MAVTMLLLCPLLLADQIIVYMSRFQPTLFSLLTSLLFVLVGNRSLTQPLPMSPNYMGRSGIDSTLRPGDDFYRFANGQWLTHTVIPQTGYRMSFTM